MAYTEFCCRSGGSNLNAGTRSGSSTEPGTSADFTYASGNWVAGTGVFTVASGNPSSDGVAVGDFASVYPDGSSVAVFIGRVTARDSTTITVSLTAKAGTAPTNGSGNRTLKIGGAWKGPNAAEAFPFGFLQNTLTNSTGNPPRVNLKNAATFSITASMVHSNAGPDFFQGYTTAYGDGGRATIDGGTSGVSYVLLNLSSNIRHTLEDLIFQNNGASAAANGVSAIRETIFRRCVFANVRGNGITVTNLPAIVVECEAYGCNQSNSSSTGGFHTTVATTFLRCIAHDNTGSNTNGFQMQSNGGRVIRCIADSNGNDGFFFAGQMTEMIECDAYNNGGDGLDMTGSGGESYVENSNFLKNGGWGINGADTSTTFNSMIVNCGFGSGTQVNTSGAINTNLNTSWVSGTITYASNVTPWVDPANGDFRINLATAKGTGRGAFTQTAASYAGTIAYPDVGAAQSICTGGHGGFGSPFISPAPPQQGV